FDPEPPKPAPEETKAEAPKAPAKGDAGEGAAKPGSPAASKGDEAAPKAPVERPCAAPPPPPPSPPAFKGPKKVATTTEWYGWQTAVMDAAAFASFFSGISDESDGSSMALAGVGIYLLGAPAVHGGNGNWGKAGASLGLRLTAPLAGAFTGALLASSRCEHESSGNCGVGEAVGGFFIGALVTPVVDALFLGKKEVPVKPASLAWRPTVLPVREGAALGIAGTF
ncbi:MAG TPA: hypothetical protein VFS00_33580, partial [Polyangiaceae bacterium]|nr:hypothetical protein [Polyangiaceae bacterium]